jgi:hypothetical protein
VAKKSSKKKGSQKREESSLAKMELETLLRSIEPPPEPEPSAATPSKLDAQILAYMLREQASRREQEGLLEPALLDRELSAPTLSGAGPLMVDTFKEGGEVEQMTVGTLPEDKEPSASFIGKKLAELGISPTDFLLMAGKVPSAVGLALTPTPAGAGEEEELARLRGLAAQETATTEGGAAKALLQAIKSKNPAAAVTAISETTKLKPSSVNTVFEEVDQIPKNQYIDDILSAHIGGVGDFGDESAKYALFNVPQGPAYIKQVQAVAKKNLGDRFMGYRLMTKDQFEDLQSGDVGDLLSFSLSPTAADSLRNFVKNQGRKDLVVAQVPLTPEHVVAFGSRGEQEIIVNTGVGWSLDEFKLAPPIRKREKGSPPEGEVSNDEFIQEMMTGTRPTDQEPDPNVTRDIVRGVQYTPFDVLGAPVDIATMVMRPFGYNVEKPVGGSDWFIEQAAKRGLAQPSTGSGAELLGRIVGGVATPAAARGVGKVGQATEDFISGQLDTAAKRVEENTLAKLRERTGNPDLTAKEVYDAMFAAQAPGAAITKPMGPTTAPVQAPQTPLGFYSAVEDTVLKLPQERGTAQQLLAQISKAPGVKTKEIEATGLAEFLRSKGAAPVTKQEIQDFLANNRVQVDEVVLGKGQILSPEAKRRMGEAENRMIEIDNELINAPYFRNVSTDDNVGDTLARLRGPLARKAAAGDAESMAEIDALNLPPDIKQLVMEFGEQKNEYQKYAKQSRRIEKPKFDKYNIPGGENAREIYLTLPGQTKAGVLPPSVDAQGNVIRPANASSPLYTAPPSHGVSPEADTNRLANIFLDDRTDAQGNKTLFVQELQSDWGQEGKRKGFYDQAPPDRRDDPEWVALDNRGRDLLNEFNRNNDKPEVQERIRPELEEVRRQRDVLDRRYNEEFQKVKGKLPPAPFVTNTEDWLNLALKRVIKEAVDSGADNVAFIKGEQAADKYSLRTVVDKIVVKDFYPADDYRTVAIVPKNGNEGFDLLVNKDGIIENTPTPSLNNLTNRPLSEAVGKEMAEKIMSGKAQVIEGDGLNIGGEGMKGFYDNIVPKTANKLLEKLGGGKVKTIEMEKEIPSRLQNYASSFMDWMNIRHPEVSSEDAARAWAMGMDNNEFVKEYYEATKPVKYIGFDITPEMREMVKSQGLPQFAAGGEVTNFIRAHA